MSMFYPAEGEKPPFHAEPEEGQVAPELPEGLSNEAEEDEAAESEAAESEEDLANGEAADAAPEAAPAESDSLAPADA